MAAAIHSSYNDHLSETTYEDLPPTKRLKVQACLRCRRRKQKCDDKRPCSACSRAGESCLEAGVPISAVNPTPWLGDIASLERRISRLEENAMQGVPPRAAIPSEEQQHMLKGSTAAFGLLATFARSEDNNPNHHELPRTPSEEALFLIYREKVHCRYPFLRLNDFQDVTKRPAGPWVPFFINMIFSIGLLLDRDNHHDHQTFYRTAVTQHLYQVFAQPDRLLHIQAYLLLAMHAIYSPSTERIISIASATMRYCVMSQLHLAAAEPVASTASAKVQIQMRRRVFWSAYALDRAVGTAFDLPFSIPDYQITVPMYANIDDITLDEPCIEEYRELPENRPNQTKTSISFARHMVYCRQIQSEILNISLHRDFEKKFDRHSDWRHRVLVKLDRWKSLCHNYADSQTISLNSSEWLHMIYNYSLAMLYYPTKSTVLGPAGDWTVKACSQACLIFRRFQRDTHISELWLGLIVQFKCGVALLYCFFATPPCLRSAAYTSPEVPEAIKSCSIILSILAERWSQAKCVRDAFDILTREINIYNTPSQRMRKESSDALASLMGELELVIVHQKTLRMIREMAFGEAPHSPPTGQSGYEEETETDGIDQNTSPQASLSGEIFQPMTPYFFQPDISSTDGFDYTTLGFPGEFDSHISF